MSQEEFTDFEVDVDLTATDAWGGEQRPLVPVGDYNLTIVGFKQDVGKESQAAYIAVTFEVADGEQVGAKVYNNYSLSSKAIGRLKSLMLACKTQLDKVVASQFMGQTIRASVVHTEGDAKIDGNGNPLPAKTFANIINEQPLEEVAKPAAAAKTPPVMNKPAAAKPANNAAAGRRA